MPELPEVETIKRQLNKLVVGRTIKGIEILREKSFSGDKEWLGAKRIVEVERKGKQLIVRFDVSERVLIIHLKMTGQLIFIEGLKRFAGGHPSPDWVAQLPNRHTRLVVTFNDGTVLYFNDMRVFGYVRLIDRSQAEELFSSKPPDVTDETFSSMYLQKILMASSRAVKVVLMDNTKIGGVGNIYANDALFGAKIDPRRKARSLKRQEVKALCVNLRRVIELGIRMGGATAVDHKYVNLDGMGGSYQDNFLVYSRDGQLCKVCNNKIIKFQLGGRGTYVCEKCQR